MRVIIKTDFHGRIKYVNRGFEKTTFYLKKNVLNGTLWNLIDLCVDAKTIEEMKEHLYSGKIFRGIIALRSKIENSVIYFEYEITPVDREGNVIDGITKSGEIDGFIFYGRKTENIDNILKINNLKECVERRVFYKTA
jgi:PAS domain-containing protein